MQQHQPAVRHRRGFSALQRAEIAEMRSVALPPFDFDGFSALQRAEIAEIR